MVSTESSSVATEQVAQAPPIATEAAPTPIATPAPAERVPINIGALQDRQQTQEPELRVIHPRSDGSIPINPGEFKVAAPVPVVTSTEPASQIPPPVAGAEASPSGAAPVAQPIETPPPSAPQGIQGDWDTLTGGRLKSQTDWETFQADQVTLANQVKQLTDSRVEFANPLVAKINDVVKSGGDLATVASLIAAQKLDPASMKPLEAIKAAVAFQHPTLDHEEVEAHLSKLGIDLSDMEGVGTRAAIKVESEKANQFLAGLKVQMDNPAVLEQAQASQAAIAANQEAWKLVPAPATTTKLTEQVGGLSISADFAFSAEANAFAAHITNEMRSLPANQQNIQNYHSLYETLARGFDSQKLIASVTAEAVRVATIEAKKHVAGPAPTPVPQATPPPLVAPKRQGHFAFGE